MEKNRSVLEAIVKLGRDLDLENVVSEIKLGYLKLINGKSGRLILHYYNGFDEEAAIYVDTLDFIDYAQLDDELCNNATSDIKNDKNSNILHAIRKIYEQNGLDDIVCHHIMFCYLREEIGKSGRLILTFENRRLSDFIYVDTLEFLTESELMSEFPNAYDVV